MHQYTPINEWKLKSKEAKDFIVMAKKMRGFSVETIRVHPCVFNELMDSMSPSIREDCKDGIPFEGKLLVRK